MLKVLIIDDEQDAIEALKIMAERYVPEISSLYTACGALAGVKAIRKYQPDLVFLDISMPVKTGFEVLEQVQDEAFDVIFITAYDQYAIQAIRFSALDYLLKPVDVDELIGAVERHLVKRNETGRAKGQRLLKNFLFNIQLTQQEECRLAVPASGGILFFPASQIVRLEGERNYTWIHLSGNIRHLSAKTIKEYEEILRPLKFIRTHKSHLVNSRFAAGIIRTGAVQLKTGEQIPISRRRRSSVFRHFLPDNLQ